MPVTYTEMSRLNSISPNWGSAYLDWMKQGNSVTGVRIRNEGIFPAKCIIYINGLVEIDHTVDASTVWEDTFGSVPSDLVTFYLNSPYWA